MAEGKSVALSDLSVAELASVSADFTSDVSSVWNYEHSVEQYTSTGGTAKSAVLHQIEAMTKSITSSL